MYIDIDSSRNFEAGFRCILDVQFLQMIFNEGDILTLKSIFHMILKDGITCIAICYLRKSQCFPFNVEC